MSVGPRPGVPQTPDYYDLLARARYFVNNVNFPNHLVKRPGTVHVMTHHGTPLKRMGLDLQDTPVAGVRVDDVACTAKTLPEFPRLWSTMVHGYEGGSADAEARIRRG